MSENTLKNELLKLHGKSAVDEEVAKLHDVLEADHRETRRLFRWTIGVWAAWIAMLAMPISRSHKPGDIEMFLGVSLMVGLPVIASFLLLKLILGRRTAGQKEIRMRLAVIEAQLQQLRAASEKGTSKP